jgi:hypothetical protein
MAGGRAAVELQLGEAMGEEILVTGETPLVNKYDATAGGSISTEELSAVPTTARNYIQALDFLPGVVNDANSMRFDGFQPGMEGSRGARAAYYIDGVDVTFSRLGGASRLQIPLSALAGTKIESSGADAQYSRTVGGVVSTVLKSGTNEFHGEAIWYARNLDWDENYDLTPVLQPDELKSSWEAALGGPIIRDKLWFFVGLADREDPGSVLLADGETLLDAGAFQENQLIKLDWRPSTSHSLSANHTEAPFKIPGYTVACGDLGSTFIADWPSEFTSLSWNWAISDSAYLESRVAAQRTNTNRVPRVDDATGPDPWRPSGNNFTYRDAVNGVFWNGPIGADIGLVEFPRDQANVSVNFFRGVHDVKVGIDYQEVVWGTDVTSVPMVIGIGYNPELPGGFARPLFYCVFFGVPEGEWVETPTENGAVYVRDRMSFDRWTFNLGLRLDNQKHENDVGNVTVDSTDIAPRLAAVYDVRGDATLLVSATAGRYTYQLPQGWSAKFGTTPAGRDFYDQFGWNPATQAYDIYQRSVLPPGAEDITQVDPRFKDELTLGADWAFHRDWAFKTKLVYWTQDKQAQIYNQLDEQGELAFVVENNPWAEAERLALHLEVKRRFRDNWMVAANYTWSETEGNCIEGTQGDTGCSPAPGRLIDVVNPDTGEPWSLHNAYGKLDTDRTHVFKVRGLYRVPLGRHSLNFAGYYSQMSGAVWTPTTEVDILDGTDTMTVNEEPRGSRRIPTFDQLNLSVEWQFPIFKGLDGAVRWDVVNVLDGQELVGTTGLGGTSQPVPSSENYQKPRYHRIMAKLTF